jgi:hypothetical protein
VDPHAEISLAGGIGNGGAVVRRGAFVLRPKGPFSPVIHELLDYVRARGFTGAPEVAGVEPDGRERLVFIEGDVPVVPFPAWSQTNALLASTASLLRRFHDATVGFVASDATLWNRELADRHPGSVGDGASGRGDQFVVCHNDVCPENVVFRDGRAVALLDFDLAAPGRRVFDVARFAMMWVPIEAPEDLARTGREGLDPIRRLRVLADGYGLGRPGTPGSGDSEGPTRPDVYPEERRELVDLLVAMADSSGEFVRRRVERGEPAFIEMWEMMGGEGRLERRRAWVHAHRDALVDALA